MNSWKHRPIPNNYSESGRRC